MAQKSPSRVLTKRSQLSGALITAPTSQPPVKRIKRPALVLEEEDYEAGVEHIIRRDFFPGLAETDAQRDYLAALESGDLTWTAEAARTLKDLRNKDSRRGRETRLSTPVTTTLHNGVGGGVGETPRGWQGDTPRSTFAGGATPVQANQTSRDGGNRSWKETGSNRDLGLTAFQQKYTSEDNESFYTLLDRSNASRAEKHAYLWNGTNKMASNRQLEESRRQRLLEDAKAKETALNGGRELVKLDTSDKRPAVPDTWKAKPNNSFMYAPDGVEDELGSEQQRREERSRMGPKEIVYENTRMAPPPRPMRLSGGAESIPASPSLSAVRDAVQGRPRLTTSMAGSTADGNGGETPRVNGWAFVDSVGPEQELVVAADRKKSRRGGNYGGDDSDSDENGNDDTKIDLGPGDATPNPFQIRGERAREALHGRVLDRINKTKAEEKSRSGFRNGVNGTPTPVGMSPAAQRLLGRVSAATTPVKGQGQRRTVGSVSASLGDGWGVVANTPRTRPALAGVTPIGGRKT